MHKDAYQSRKNLRKDNKEEYGGQIRWLYLAILILNVVVLIFYVLWLLKKRLEENKDKN